jgi:hypothetical protein
MTLLDTELLTQTLEPIISMIVNEVKIYICILQSAAEIK